jgi:hypothetical protein
MKKKKMYFCLLTAALLILSIFPSIQSINIESESITSENDIHEKEEIDSKPISFDLYHIKEDGTKRITRRTLSTSEVEEMEEKLIELEVEDATAYDIFLGKFNILKEYKIIPDNIEFDDVIDPEILNSDINVVSDEDFDVTTAPIFFVGGGLGAGIGFPFILTLGAFLVALFGFGITLCYDLFSNTLYQLYTPSFIPILIGLLFGFVGLILLPVVPGFLYSNFFGIGAVAYTRWIQWSPY